MRVYVEKNSICTEQGWTKRGNKSYQFGLKNKCSFKDQYLGTYCQLSCASFPFSRATDGYRALAVSTARQGCTACWWWSEGQGCWGAGQVGRTSIWAPCLERQARIYHIECSCAGAPYAVAAPWWQPWGGSACQLFARETTRVHLPMFRSIRNMGVWTVQKLTFLPDPCT